MNGIVLTRQLLEENPSLGVIVLTLHEDRNLVDQSLDAGARGYVLKKSTAECLIHAIRGVLVGGLYIDPAIARRMFDAPIKTRRSPGAPSLTEREADVLKLVALGSTNREIAEQLGLSAKSVETYKARGAAKANLKTRRDIVRYASAQGWLGNL
jgi:DNA-binding NarL/FixJ family response regulator